MSRQHKIETIKRRKALAKSRYVIKEDLTKENENLVYELQNSDNVEAAKRSLTFAIFIAISSFFRLPVQRSLHCPSECIARDH
jgi:hypothetical protein